ncbi:MAG: MATE family efflux transporter [Clostridiales bacterium]|nr:MATE family efflux transporter [Clostridiales bacterium]
MKTAIFVKDRSFYKTIVRLSIPAAFQALISLLVNMADNVMVSQYSALALAPVSQANSVSTFVTAALTGLGNGAVVLISQYWGKRDTAAAKKITAVAVSLCFLFALLMVGLIQIFPHAVISLVLDPGQTELMPIALSYLRIACLSFLPLAVTSALVGALKGVEVVKVTLYATVISLLSNVVLNYLLIFGKLGLPEMGIQGAALATVLARFIEVAVVCVYAFRMQKNMDLKPGDLLHHEKWAWRDYFRFGAPVGLNGSQWALVGLLKMAMIGHLGQTMMTSMNITEAMMNLGTMFTFALAGGACVVVGKAVGKGDYDTARQYSVTIQIMFALIGIFMALVVIVLRHFFIGLYDQTADVESLASTLIVIGALTLIGTSYHASCFKGINQGAGDSRFVMTVDLICGWLVVLPLTYLGAFVFHWPLPIVYLCSRIDQCFKWLIAFIRLRGNKWIKNVTRK